MNVILNHFKLICAVFTVNSCWTLPIQSLSNTEESKYVYFDAPYEALNYSVTSVVKGCDVTWDSVNPLSWLKFNKQTKPSWAFGI